MVKPEFYNAYRLSLRSMTTWNLNGMARLVLMCNGDTCSQHGADEVTVALRRELSAQGLDPLVHTARTRCLGRCEDACTVVVQPDNIWYRDMTPELAVQLVSQHLKRGEPMLEQASFLPVDGVLQQISGFEPSTDKPQRTTVTATL